MKKRLICTSNNQIIWTIITCYLISSFSGGIVAFIPPIQWMIMTPIWFLLSGYIDKHFYSRVLNRGKYLILFLIIVYLSSIYENQFINPTSRGMTVLFISYCIYIFVNTEKHRDWGDAVVIFFLVEHLLQLLYTCYLLIDHPRLVRELLNSIADAPYTFALSFAGVYVSIVLQVFLISNFRQIKKTYKILVLLTIVSQFVLAMMANLATVMILMVVFPLLSVGMKNGKIVLSVIIIGFLLLYFGRAIIGFYIIEYYSKFNFSKVISDKLYELGMALQGISVTNENATFAARYNLFFASLNAFWEHPIWGVYGTQNAGSVGGHTTWLDYLGMFGIIRGWSFWTFLISWRRQVFQNITHKGYINSFYLSILIYVIEGFLNPIIKPGIVFFIFLILPCSRFMFKDDCYLEKKEK